MSQSKNWTAWPWSCFTKVLGTVPEGPGLGRLWVDPHSAGLGLFFHPFTFWKKLVGQSIPVGFSLFFWVEKGLLQGHTRLGTHAPHKPRPAEVEWFQQSIFKGNVRDKSCRVYDQLMHSSLTGWSPMGFLIKDLTDLLFVLWGCLENKNQNKSLWQAPESRRPDFCSQLSH